MSFTQIVTIAVFIITFIFIVSEKINRTVAAMIGAMFLLIIRLINEKNAVSFIDYTTVGVLVGMMIVVSIIKRTGLFQYIAIKSAKIAKGEPMRIIILFGVMTGVLSAFLDNVTTILLMIPITLVISKLLKITPIPFIMSEVLASNIGGTGTLIGDPPNIMIGSEAGLSFLNFITNLFPVTFIILLLSVIIIRRIYKNELIVDDKLKKQIMELDELKAITDKKLLYKSLVVLGFIILGFFMHEHLKYESSTVALTGAAVFLLISGIEVDEILVEIEWPTIFFFISLFIIVGTLEEVGIINILAKAVVSLTKGNLTLTGIIILWSSAILSAFLDNIPFVATMIPLIKGLGAISHMNITPLWWALSLGACLGGNGTLIGASANVVTVGVMEKEGYKITFKDFMKIGFPIMIFSIIISTIYLLIFQLR
ncbi:possible tyrosine transporter P-protein [Caloramator quimbayensis]|uniref:Possible tyrosine transporter P-protein n=1 Tax=Caloramator quimbayensis TaxID=1147123 RepID=A0A1T4WQ84_9CLOT|nr:ArsB/NhaD family transporter [Caloramator quimbayensis]SKA79419.1 possible tyrosine transporter P-protein [Caloramator quimbayensis]